MKPTRFTEEMVDEYVRKGYWDSTLISDYWDQNAVLYPNEEAIVDENVRLTWSQAKQQIDRIALGLLELGIKKNEKIAVQLYNCVEHFTFRLACEKAGIIAVTLLPTFRHLEVSAILKHTTPVGIVIPVEFRNLNYFRIIQEIHNNLPSLKFIFVIGDDVPEGAISVKEMSERPIEKKYPSDYLQRRQNIHPFEIENILTRHPKVLKAAVVGIPDTEMGERVCAYVVLKSREEFSFSKMVQFMRDQGIASFKIPERLEITNDLPLVGGIKVDKKRLIQDIETELRR